MRGSALYVPASPISGCFRSIFIKGLDLEDVKNELWRWKGRNYRENNVLVPLALYLWDHRKKDADVLPALLKDFQEEKQAYDLLQFELLVKTGKLGRPSWLDLPLTTDTLTRLLEHVGGDSSNEDEQNLLNEKEKSNKKKVLQLLAVLKERSIINDAKKIIDNNFKGKPLRDVLETVIYDTNQLNVIPPPVSDRERNIITVYNREGGRRLHLIDSDTLKAIQQQELPTEITGIFENMAAATR